MENLYHVSAALAGVEICVLPVPIEAASGAAGGTGAKETIDIITTL